MLPERSILMRQKCLKMPKFWYLFLDETVFVIFNHREAQTEAKVPEDNQSSIVSVFNHLCSFLYAPEATPLLNSFA